MARIEIIGFDTGLTPLERVVKVRRSALWEILNLVVENQLKPVIAEDTVDAGREAQNVVNESLECLMVVLFIINKLLKLVDLIVCHAFCKVATNIR